MGWNEGVEGVGRLQVAWRAGSVVEEKKRLWKVGSGCGYDCGSVESTEGKEKCSQGYFRIDVQWRKVAGI